jgi:hypothetical protein
MNRDLKNNLDVAETIAPAARTASVSGTGVDLLGYEGAMALIHHGDWTDGTHVFEVQESDVGDTSPDTYTAVADADLLGSEPTISSESNDDTITRIGYIGSKRYIRVITTYTASTTPQVGAVFGAVIVRGRPHQAPLA